MQSWIFLKKRNRQSRTWAILLDYMKVNRKLDTSGVEPIVSCVSVDNVFREDVVTNGDESVAMLKNAPQSKEIQFQVL